MQKEIKNTGYLIQKIYSIELSWAGNQITDIKNVVIDHNTFGRCYIYQKNNVSCDNLEKYEIYEEVLEKWFNITYLLNIKYHDYYMHTFTKVRIKHTISDSIK